MTVRFFCFKKKDMSLATLNDIQIRSDFIHKNYCKAAETQVNDRTEGLTNLHWLFLIIFNSLSYHL